MVLVDISSNEFLDPRPGIADLRWHHGISDQEEEDLYEDSEAAVPIAGGDTGRADAWLDEL